MRKLMAVKKDSVNDLVNAQTGILQKVIFYPSRLAYEIAETDLSKYTWLVANAQITQEDWDLIEPTLLAMNNSGDLKYAEFNKDVAPETQLIQNLDIKFMEPVEE
jgi:hypothetical protein